MKKRLISMFLVLVMALGLFPISAFAASSTIGGALGEVLCYAPCGGLHQSKAFTRYGDP